MARVTPPHTVQDTELLDVHAVARLLRCSPRHVRRLADSERMPAPLHLGALVRWPREELLEWIAEGCPTCTKGRRQPRKP